MAQEKKLNNMKKDHEDASNARNLDMEPNGAKVNKNTAVNAAK